MRASDDDTAKAAGAKSLWSPQKSFKDLTPRARDVDVRRDAHGSGPTILVVDDEPDIVDTLKVSLEHGMDNVHVLTARNGLDAIHILEQNKVDLIITDYRMPGINGLEFLRRADDVAPRAARILMSAYLVGLPTEISSRRSVHKVLSKPLAMNELLDAVRKALHSEVTQ